MHGDLGGAFSFAPNPLFGKGVQQSRRDVVVALDEQLMSNMHAAAESTRDIKAAMFQGFGQYAQVAQMAYMSVNIAWLHCSERPHLEIG